MQIETAPLTAEETEFLTAFRQLTPRAQRLVGEAVMAITEGEDADKVLASLSAA